MCMGSRNGIKAISKHTPFGANSLKMYDLHLNSFFTTLKKGNFPETDHFGPLITSPLGELLNGFS
jgi:hypothetical protein